MNVVVFTGPTLPQEEVARELEARCCPPAAQGDVLREARRGARVIALIDGYFEGIASVWHKEILWALARGVHVLGASSMGALRAAELAPFGMVGIGEVHDAYASGDLDADDEVAVAHADRDDGYRPLSEAMVNIRATLRAACRQGAISSGSLAAFEGIAKSLFYADRSYPLVLRLAATQGIDPGEIRGLRLFLETGAVNQKKVDAVALLRFIRSNEATFSQPKTVPWHFEETDAWIVMYEHA
jgi:hypothetical protein